MKYGGEEGLTLVPVDNTLRDEALQGLLALGFNKIAVQKVLNRTLKERNDIKSVEELIKAALPQL